MIAFLLSWSILSPAPMSKGLVGVAFAMCVHGMWTSSFVEEKYESIENMDLQNSFRMETSTDFYTFISNIFDDKNRSVLETMRSITEGNSFKKILFCLIKEQFTHEPLTWKGWSWLRALVYCTKTCILKSFSFLTCRNMFNVH